ncbi:MAG: ABC transporter permease [Acidobacteria bacterium]|nr:ABC transporter permease [Acidobacteriota bacterium]
MIHTGYVRLGGAALVIDGLAALGCYIASYRLRFDDAEFRHFLAFALRALPAFALAHVGVLAAAGLYRLSGQALWPLKLTLGTVTAAAIAFALVVVTLGEQGQSRQAVVVYALMLTLVCLAWRAAVGLRMRWQALRGDVPPGALEVRGEHHRSMSGGLLLAWRYRHLLRNLVAKDLRLKYRGSILGFAWSLLNPLLMIGVYTFAFTYIMQVGTPRFAFFVLIGLLAWNFFAGAVMGSAAAIADGGSLIKSVLFPRVILPISGVVFNGVQYLLTVAVFLPVMLVWYQVPPGPQMLLFPIFLALQVLFISGLALMLSTATAWLRDVRHLIEVMLGVAFWATPIIYEQSRVPEELRFALLLSPMASFVRAYQDIFYYLTPPDLAVWIVAAAYGIGAFVCGVSVFVAYEGGFAEQV